MAVILIGYDTETAAVGEGLARFTGPELPAVRAGARPGDDAREALELLTERARGASGVPARSSSAAARSCTRSTRSSRAAASGSSTSSSTPTATSSSATCATRRARAPRQSIPATPPVALREELAVTSRADPRLPRRASASACGRRSATTAACATGPTCSRSSARHGPPLRHLVGPQRGERQPDAVGAAVRLRGGGLPGHPRDPVPVLARRDLVRRARLRHGRRRSSRR